MRQAIITAILILAIIGLLSVIVLGSRNKSTTSNLSQNSQESHFESASATNNNGPILFYGNTCPHCDDVEEWMMDNKVEEKIEIVKKEVYDNQNNARELSSAAQGCGLDANNIGVPFLYAENECYIGMPEIVSYLSQKARL